MLSLSLVTLGLAAFGAYAKSTPYAIGGLEVYLSTPSNKVASASDIKIFATVKNIGDEDLKIFKPGTVLDHEYHTLSFNVTEDGKEVPFTGTAVPEDGLSEKYWIVIGAGKNVTAEHDALSGLYNFAASGPRTLTFDPVSTFEVIGRDATRFEIVKASSISITIGGDASKRELGLEKRYATCPYPDKELFMSMGASEAVTLSRGALSYLDSHDVNDDLYRMYFGLKDMKDKVKENFKLIEGVDSKAMTLTCWDIRGFCTKDAQGYSIKDESTVVVCGGFFTHSPLSTLCRIDDGIVRGGITLRYMATVVMPGVFDATKGCDRAQPGNDYLAGNYECFATAVYKRTKCGQ